MFDDIELDANNISPDDLKNAGENINGIGSIAMALGTLLITIASVLSNGRKNDNINMRNFENTNDFSDIDDFVNIDDL